MATRQRFIRVAWVAAGAFAFAASGVSAQEVSSARASVTASATILSPVGLHAPSALSLESGVNGLSLQGTLEVRSPAPHVVSANARAWDATRGSTGFSPVRGGTWGASHQDLSVDVTPSADGGPARVTYVVAVIL